MKTIAFLLLTTISMAGEEGGVRPSTPGRDSTKKRSIIRDVIYPEIKEESASLPKPSVPKVETPEKELAKRLKAKDVLYSA